MPLLPNDFWESLIDTYKMDMRQCTHTIIANMFHPTRSPCTGLTCSCCPAQDWSGRCPVETRRMRLLASIEKEHPLEVWNA